MMANTVLEFGHNYNTGKTYLLGKWEPEILLDHWLIELADEMSDTAIPGCLTRGRDVLTFKVEGSVARYRIEQVEGRPNLWRGKLLDTEGSPAEPGD